MDDRLLDKIAAPFNPTLPEGAQTLEEKIDQVLPAVARYSDFDLTREDSPVYQTDWIKMSDQPGMTVISLHTFMPSGEIRIANDGAMDAASHKVISPSRLIIGQSISRDSYLYELAFMDNDFLIFERHGNQANFRGSKYLFYARESIGTRLDWDEALDRLVIKYRNNAFPWWIVIVLLLVVLGIVVYLR